VPYLGEEDIANVMFLLEVTWWAHRALWHLIFSGVLERHPDLQLVLTEQGTAWIPETLRTLDYFFHRLRDASGSQEAEWGGPVRKLSLTPSEYWARQCHVGCSFLRPSESPLRDVVGVGRMMWGSDYPHLEGSHPYTREALRAAFAGVDEAEVQPIVGANAARVYGFDLGALTPIAERVGPTVEEVARPLDEVPTDGDRCPALAEAAIMLDMRRQGAM
jgi:predicted TIM-barrel fold metal-dependent hydrolase